MHTKLPQIKVGVYIDNSTYVAQESDTSPINIGVHTHFSVKNSLDDGTGYAVYALPFDSANPYKFIDIHSETSHVGISE